MKRPRYIFVIGGVVSGVGKGITTASIAKILQGKGYRVSPIKIDPYLNVDAGTMNPTEHGEVFVLDSGLECDQDLGNYERFLDTTLPLENYMTSGMIYQSVLERERNLGYGGKCIEAVPHVVQEIIRRLKRSVKKTKADITIIEIGGTVGDFQNALFIEAARTLHLENPGDVLFVMVSYLPIPGKIGEMKTRPTQHAIRTLNSFGIQPDIIIARGEEPIDKKRKEKIAISSNVPLKNIVSAPDIESIYEVPLNFEKDGLSRSILSFFNLKAKKTNLREWRSIVTRAKRAKQTVKIGVIGKYFKTGNFMLADSYISIIEALKHAAFTVGVRPDLQWLDAENFERSAQKLKEIEELDGILIPGGFGTRGTEGKIRAIGYARKNGIPFFGICYGMQMAVVEYARSVLGLRTAHSTEVDKNARHPVIDVMPEQIRNIAEAKYGGTMRLGGWPAKLKKGTIVREIYGADKIRERHRHRYEVNPEYVERLEEEGLVFSGISPDGKLAEIMELPRDLHPFFIGTQFHPEFQTSLTDPHPIFREFIRTSLERQMARK